MLGLGGKRAHAAAGVIYDSSNLIYVQSVNSCYVKSIYITVLPRAKLLFSTTSFFFFY